MTDLSGQQFGNYRLERLIGKGGFADVYLGNHIYLHTQAAIKILQVRLTHDALESFLSEARTVVQLDHPHIVHVLECSVEKEVPFLAMNYAPGGSLRQRYPLGTRLPLEQVARYVSQIASALQYAHNRKLIHRDIKPENMLVGQDEQLLLSDFGLVILAQSTGAQTIKEMAGTVPYMAPEQLQGKPRATSDQYALAIVAYEWLSGERPFRGSFVEIASQHVLAPPPALFGTVAGITRETEQVIFKALAKNPEERFPSVQAFADALAQVTMPTLSIGQFPTPPAIALDAGPTLAATGQRAPATPPGALSTPVLSTPGQTFQSGNTTISQGEISESDLPTYISNPRLSAMPGSANTPVNYPAGAQAPTPYAAVVNTPANYPSGAGAPVPYAGNANTPVSYSSATHPQFLPQMAAGAPYAGVPSAQRALTQKPRRSRALVLALLSLILILLFVLTPLLLFTPLGQNLGFGGAGGHATPTAGPGNTTPIVQGSPSTVTPTATATATPTATPTFTPTPTTPAFSVIGASATVDPSDFHGTCSSTMTFTFTGTIQVPSGTAGGTVSYTWLRSDNASSPTETVNFNPGDTSQTVTTTWQLGSTWGNGTTFWEALKVTSPNSATSNHANFSFVCTTPSFSVTSISASVSPDSYTCGQSSVTFNFSAVISVPAGTSGGTITYTWERSDGASMTPVTVSVAAGQTSVTVTDTWTLFSGVPNGTYWEKVVVSSPNSASSNKATFTVSC